MSVPSIAHIRVARTLMSTNQAIKICRVLNIENFPVYVKKNKSVASLSVVDEIVNTLVPGKIETETGLPTVSKTAENQKAIFINAQTLI